MSLRHRILAAAVGVWVAAGVLGNAASAQANIFIHEVLADPAPDVGDANGDGSVSSSADEFVELYNDSDEAVNLSGWVFADALKTRHIFADGAWIDPSGLMVVFGGNPVCNGFLCQAASSGTLSLNNGGDTLRLFDSSDMLIDEWIYGSEGGKDESLVRIGDQVFLHTDVEPGVLFSPGRLTGLAQASAGVVPEPLTVLSFFSGISGLVVLRRFKTDKI